jgi:protein-L-isoaspartate O-methyltransferase
MSGRANRGKVDRDIPLPIGGDQLTTQPSLLAAMVAALALEGHERVLEVGTGLGYHAAVLGRLAREYGASSGARSWPLRRQSTSRRREWATFGS